MKAQAILLSTLLAASVAGNVYLYDGSKYEQVTAIPDPVLTDSNVLHYATKACLKKLDKLGAEHCTKGLATLVVAKGAELLWLCDGGVVPQAVQVCLNKAADDMAAAGGGK